MPRNLLGFKKRGKCMQEPFRQSNIFSILTSDGTFVEWLFSSKDYAKILFKCKISKKCVETTKNVDVMKKEFV